MKKLAAALFCISLVSSLAVPAFAESSPESAAAEPVVINWSDVEPTLSESGAEGDFVTFDEIAVKMWVPTALQAVELTDEDREAGYIGYFQSADESAAVAVQYIDLDGMELEEYAAALPDYGAEDIQMAVLNELPAVSYVIKETDTASVAFTTEMGYVLEISFWPYSDEGFSAVSAIMVSSIQAEEDAEVESSAA